MVTKIEMYSTHKEGTSVVVERFIRTLKNKMHKHVTTILQNWFTDKSDNIIYQCNNTYHRTSKMTTIDVISNTYLEYAVVLSKHKVGDHVRTSFLQKIILQIGQNKFLLSNWLKILCNGHMLFVILTLNKLLSPFLKNSCKRQIKQILELKK